MQAGFPTAFQDRMQQRFSEEEWSAFMAAHQHTAPVSIRLNPSKYLTDQNEPVPWCAAGRYLSERPSFTLDPCFHSGAYYVQEASSMFLEQAFIQCVPEHKPLRVLDLCAAPGGKSTHILGLASSETLVVSNEVIRSRVGILEENIQKWGYPNAVITSNDASDFRRLEGFFDVIVVDAPCSGEGLFRKDPGAMTEWSTRNTEICSARQKRIVEDVWPSLKENGLLIYSTCTYNREENEGNLQWLKDQHEVESVALDVPANWNVQEVIEGNMKGYQLFPHRVKGEGFFLAVVRKTEGQHEFRSRRVNKPFAKPGTTTSRTALSWLHDGDQIIIQRGDTIQALPGNHAEDISTLAASLNVVYAGTYIAKLKGEKLVPEHSLAVSTILNKASFPTEELTLSDAITYLRKDPLHIESGKKGYALATYNGLGIGWMNVIQGRTNNLYPQEWRIRMRQ